MRVNVFAFVLAPMLALVPAKPAVAPEPHKPEITSRLQNDIERLINSPGWRGDKWSVMVVSLDKGDTLVSHEADQEMMPASNLKLFTTAAVLYYLGPQFRYNTFLLSDGKLENGILNGDLIVYGTGDPSFSVRFGRRDEIWHAFADTLAAMGVKEIRGNVIGDASYFKGPGHGAGWQANYINASYAAPASALTYAENIATLQIKPSAPGQRPQVTLVGGATDIAVVNEATTVARGRSYINATRTGYDGPILVRGQISSRGGTIQRTIPVADPAQYSAAVFRQILKDKGITVTGTPKSVINDAESPVTGRAIFAPALDTKTTPVRVLAIHQSPPLLDIVDIINKKSHNLFAEQAARTTGRIVEGEGSAQGNMEAVVSMFKRESGNEPALLHMDDGSGLSVYDRTNARTIIQLLSFMAKTPVFDAYYETLPEAGVPNGLHRMYGTKAAGNLKAKTGTIDNVSALSGYVTASDGERLAFSIISNNVPSTYRAKRIEDAIGARLANYNRNNDVATLSAADLNGGVAPKVVKKKKSVKKSPVKKKRTTHR